MAKWFGKVGYAVEQEIEPGIWDQPEIIEREYYGETIKNYNRNQNNSGEIMDGLTVTNNISIVADPFARDNFCNLCYVEYMGTKWKVSSAEYQHPRLILTLGGRYNGY